MRCSSAVVLGRPAYEGIGETVDEVCKEGEERAGDGGSAASGREEALAFRRSSQKLASAHGAATAV